MISEEMIKQRIQQLQAERAGVAQGVQHMAAEIKRGRYLLNTYDGAIGELIALITPGDVDESDQTPE